MSLSPGELKGFLRRWVKSLVSAIKFKFYMLLTRPHHWYGSMREFRFRIPWMLKRTDRLTSTEADALRFLHATGLNLPIPRLVDSFAYDGRTYTVMTRLPGNLLIHESEKLEPSQRKAICSEIEAILHKLWQIPQPESIAGTVMLSASGHDLPDPRTFFESRTGPYSNILQCYEAVGSYGSREEFEEHTDANTRDVLQADRIVWVHTDLRAYNIFVEDGHVSGIID